MYVEQVPNQNSQTAWTGWPAATAELQKSPTGPVLAQEDLTNETRLPPTETLSGLLASESAGPAVLVQVCWSWCAGAGVVNILEQHECSSGFF